MSDITIDEIESKLRLVIRKPQEGKTFICIHSIICDTSLDIHFVLTMNTIGASIQFFGRMEEMIGASKLLVFNSNKSSAGNCLHVKDVNEVTKRIKQNPTIKVIVCCSHTKRFREDILDILDYFKDSKDFENRGGRFRIHMDEAHKYIPENREYIRKLNNHEMVSKMIGYSASPDPIFTPNPSDTIFNNIYICDPEKEYNMIRSDKYFGVKNCIPIIMEETATEDQIMEHAEEIGIHKDPYNIEPHIVEKSLMKREKDQGTIKPKYWYDKKYPFDNGNERLLLCFLQHVLPTLVHKPDQSSYHFIPAYSRKVTHHKISEIILGHYPNANIIIMNGDGIQLFKLTYGRVNLIKTHKEIECPDEKTKKQLLEPSFVIQKLIQDYPDCPTFVTGCYCVSMSVTLINEDIGNFDSIVMVHDHYSKEDIYQLCRFLFNYSKWSHESIIKQTRFISYTREVYDICLDYENYIEKLTNEFAGHFCKLNEVRDIEPIEPSVQEIRRMELDSILPYIDVKWKKFEVDSEDPDDELLQISRVENYYKKKHGKDMNKNSKFKIYEPDPRFKTCSTTGEVMVYTNDEMQKFVKSIKTWDSLFQLVANKTNYASRMFVSYDDKMDPTKYTIWIKSATLEKNEKVFELLNKYGKSKSKKKDTECP